MKIATNPSSIIAACEACIKAIDAERAVRNQAALARYNAPGFWPVLARKLISAPKPATDFAADYTIAYLLLAIAKHKRGSALLELEGNDLRVIGQFLEPWENPRI